MFSSFARQSIALASRSSATAATVTKQSARCLSAFPAPRLFDYETVTSNLSVSDAIESVEEAFSKLAKGKVEVPMPMVRFCGFLSSVTLRIS